ncbi:MAG: S-layer homology domain-containing protein [Actinomycetota bacterium]
MNLSRRALLRVAAVAPAVAVVPSLARSAGASATLPVLGERIVERDGIAGVSLSWVGERHGAVARVALRVEGVWQAPFEVWSDHDHGPADTEGREHAAAILHPDADAYRVEALRGVDARDLRVHLLDPGPSPLRLASDTPSTVAPIPGLEIIERGNWTTRGRRDTIDCAFRSSVFGLGCRSDVGLRHAVVHHTVNVNDYAPEHVPELLRGIQTFHMDTRGWNDIAYNFVVDRFGRIWHAREGDITEPITGGHTTGLNAESVGVAVLGTFVEDEPAQAVVDAISVLLGWKLSLHGVDPWGSTSVRSGGGDFAEPGEMVTVRNVSGHLDNQITSCPGTALYERLDEIRTTAAELVPVFGHLTPRYHDDRVEIEGWAIDRLVPEHTVELDIEVDGEPFETIAADIPLDPVWEAYPDAGPAHGFLASVPITIDTTSIVVTARSADGRTATLMDLVLFATFIDVQPHRFFAPGIYFLKEQGLTTGTFPGLYEPMDEMSRAQMATFLWRFMGEPTAAQENPFDDVERGRWFTEAIDWLYEQGITTGTSPQEFSPGLRVTRAQMATFLWRLCGRQSADAAHPFVDVPEGEYYSEPVRWMYDLGITTGTSDTTYTPLGDVTRGEIATFLHRLAQQPAAWTITEPPFTFDDD